MSAFNTNDLQIWENLFETIPEDTWKIAPASKAMEACLDFFIANKVKTVLDVGCGVGRWAIYLAKNGLRVTGTDFSANAVRIAQEWAAAESLEIEFAHRTLVKSRFPARKFDGIVAALILDIVSRDEMTAGIRNMHLCLANGGYLFALFNPPAARDLNKDREDDKNPTAGVTRMTYTDEEIIRAFTGFTCIKRGTYEADLRGFFFQKVPDAIK